MRALPLVALAVFAVGCSSHDPAGGTSSSGSTTAGGGTTTSGGTTGGFTTWPPGQTYPVFLTSGPQSGLDSLGTSLSAAGYCADHPFGTFFELGGTPQYCTGAFNAGAASEGLSHPQYGYWLAIGYQADASSQAVLMDLTLQLSTDGFEAGCTFQSQGGGNSDLGLGDVVCNTLFDVTLVDRYAGGPLVSIAYQGTTLGTARMLPLACGAAAVNCYENCTDGAPCTPKTVCNAGQLNCSAPDCVDQGGPASEGTVCGKDQVCHNGACTPCVAGQPCTPANGCHTGSTTCETGVQTCYDESSSVADGTRCGDAGLCKQGACKLSDGQSCFSYGDCYGACACADAQCATRFCRDTALDCHYVLPDGGWAPLQDEYDSPACGETMGSVDDACYGGRCALRTGQACTSDGACGTGFCECTNSDCSQRTCATADCLCGYGVGGACWTALANGTQDPGDCESPHSCVDGGCL